MRDTPLILVVDDEEGFREIAGVRLKAAGYECAFATNEKEALEQAETLLPDLILMDIHMPGETGTDAALSIRQNPKTKDIHIAFLSSLRDPWPAISGDRKQIAQELGMVDFLDKTEDLDRLAEKVAAILAAEKAEEIKIAPQG